VYTLGWSFDGKYFASGSADENAIVWDGKTLEGVIRFNHNGNKIQCVAWSPVTNVLVSCSEKDFGFWYRSHIPPSPGSACDCAQVSLLC
jgi:intraflagellar transport protein 122